MSARGGIRVSRASAKSSAGVHEILADVLARGLVSTVGRLAGSRFTAMIFHRVLPEPDPLYPSIPHAEGFEAAMAALARNFRMLSLREAVASGEQEANGRAGIVVTFDDGYADNEAVAAPILQRLGIPAIFFVATGFLNGGRMWNDSIIEAVRRWDRPMLDLSDLGLGTYALQGLDTRRKAIASIIAKTKYLPFMQREATVQELVGRLGILLPDNLMMTSEQVRALAKQGMEIGAHTVHHPILTQVPDDVAKREIEHGKSDLEALTGSQIDLFAYPNGKPGIDYSRVHVEMVRQAGFIAAVSTAPGAGCRDDNIYQIPRYTPWSRQPAKFMLQLAGNYARTRYSVV